MMIDVLRAVVMGVVFLAHVLWAPVRVCIGCVNICDEKMRESEDWDERAAWGIVKGVVYFVPLAGLFLAHPPWWSFGADGPILAWAIVWGVAICAGFLGTLSMLLADFIDGQSLPDMRYRWMKKAVRG